MGSRIFHGSFKEVSRKVLKCLIEFKALARVFQLTLFEPTLLYSSCVPGGGADLPTLEFLPSDDNATIFFRQSSCLGREGQNLKPHPSILKNVALRFFLKNHCFFCKKSKIFENLLFGNQTCYQKNVSQNGTKEHRML